MYFVHQFMKFQLYYILTNVWYGQSFSNLCLGEWCELRSTKLPVLFCRSVFPGWSCLAVPIFPPCFMSSSPRGSNFAVSQGFGQVSYTDIGPHSFSSLLLSEFLNISSSSSSPELCSLASSVAELRFFHTSISSSSSCSYGGWGDCFCLCKKGLNF